jgi:DNA helicase-2/ATP-dependent DNA helicase PcrA
MLRAHAEVLGFQRGFTIYDAGDAESAVERIMKELNLDTKRLSPRSVTSAISAAKNEMLSPAGYEASGHGDDPYHRRVAEIYRLYADRLKLANAMDFDDLLLNAVEMMKRDPDVLRSYQDRFKYLRSIETSAWWVTRTSRSTVSAPPTCAISSSSNSVSPTRT